jgi:glycosyltransferase involved in cell wall biosynthesis
VSDRRYKIVLFIPNLQQGGAERQILELATRLPARFDPVLCVSQDVVHYSEYLPPGLRRHVLGGGRMGRKGLARLAEFLRQEQPDILHSYRDKANFWARLAALRVPVPIVLTGVRNRAIGLPYLATEWYLSRRTDRVLTNSEGVRRELIRFARVKPSKIQIIHNFIDTERFRPPSPEERVAARARFGLADDDVALLVPGRVSLQKHQMGLARAMAMMKKRGRLAPNVRVLLAGRERDRFYSWLFPRWASWLGVDQNVVRLGTVKDMPTLYHAADVLVLPSLWEGLPNAVLEGQASALPAVVSHAANIDKIVLDGISGFEVPTFHARALASALERILDVGHQARQEMGRRGREHVVATFSPERVLRETIALYDSLIAEKGLS